MAHRPLRVSLWDRAPAQSAPPTLTELDGVVAPSEIKLVEKLNAAEELSFKMRPHKQSAEVRSRFLDLLANATEVTADDPHTGARLFCGPLAGFAPRLEGDEITWEVRAFGLLDYLKRMRIEPDISAIVFTGQDQTTIVKGLVDYYQGLDYGDYGIDTTNMDATGVTRDRTYLASENHLIDQRIAELSAVDNGFDYGIDSATRELLIYSPTRGQDRTGLIVVDRRSIADPSAQISAGPEDVATVGYALGDNGLVSAAAVNTPLMQAVGRSTFTSSFNGVTQQATIDDHAQRLVDQRSTQFHDPPKVLFPIGFDWDDFGVGDLVQFHYDYGAGLMTEDRRIIQRELTIDPQGSTRINVGFV